MTRKAVKAMQVVAVLLLGCLALSKAQQGEATARQEVSNEKRALVKELLDLTNSKQTSDAMFNAQFDQMEKQLPEIEWQVISAMENFKKLTAAQRDELRAKVNLSSLRLSKRMRELFLQRIDMRQLVEDISYSVYDKHFTVEELRDLVAFNKSPTGKKVLEVMPALFAESVAKTSEIVTPKVKEIVDEIQKDETKQLAQEVDLLLKSRPKPTPPKKRPASRRP